MKFKVLNGWKLWQKLTLLTIVSTLSLIVVLILIIFLKQDVLVQGEIDALNKTHKGLIVVGDSHVAPFQNFPYISIKVDDVTIYESKEDSASVILEVADIYVGFVIWDLLAANYDIQKLIVEDGFFNIITHKDGRINLENALAAPNETEDLEDIEEPFDIHLESIELKNLDVHNLDEGDNLDIETFIHWAKSGVKTERDKIAAHIDAEFELNIINNRDTSFIKQKHFEFHTDILYDEMSGLLEIAPSGIKMENGDFKVDGSIQMKQDMTLDLHVNGTKPNFDMLIAFAPEDLIPTLERYNNAGEFYFRADVLGPTANGQMPFIDLEFGADEAFLENVDVRKRVDELGFKGHFTTGKEKSFETMEFSLEDFSSKLEEGSFTANVLVKNFVNPDVDLELHTDFDLEFLTQFFNLPHIENPSGHVALDMRFHDIIDLEHPEKALNELNQAYFSELNIQNLHLESPDLPAHIDNLDLQLTMNGKSGVLDTFNLQMGSTDLTLKGNVTNLPAIVHHTDLPVEAVLDVSSNLFNIAELTGFTRGDTTGINEKIKDLSMLLKFKSSARAFTESKYLPEGEFIVERLHAQLESFPHEIREFYADLLIDSSHLRIVDFKGFIDSSDFDINGNIHNYGLLMNDTLRGDLILDIPFEAELEINSDLLDIAELTGYTEGDSIGIDEQIEDLNVQLSFKSNSRALADYVYLPECEFLIEGLHAQLKHYPHELHDFHADIIVDDSDINVVDFIGYIDDSDFHVNGNIHDYGFWMKDTLAGDVKLDFSLHADMLRLEDLFSYQGENYVPEDYRHEEFDKLKLHVNAAMHYTDVGLQFVDIDLDQFDAKMKVHPMRFEDFSGKFHYEDDHLMIESMHGQMGRTIFDMDMNYYLGEDESIKIRDNHFGLKANFIDFDQLTAFNTNPPNRAQKTETKTPSTEDVEAHSEAYNIYELPFTDMTFDVDVEHFIYHRIDLQRIHSRFRTTHDHYLYIDTMSMEVADGKLRMSGYFNGSDPDRIYLKPRLQMEHIDLDKMLFKFENFGQDNIVSDNIHGEVSADITGNIRIYPDLVPDLDQSEIHMDVEIYNGRLENYEPVLMLSDYMGDKNLSSIRFDTLQNHMDITNGVITIPNMTIESTLGHYELSGEQSMLGALDYYIRIPWKIVKQATLYKLFGKKNRKDGEVIDDDEIIEKDPTKKTRYLNLSIKGTLDDYDIKLFKKKKE